MDAKQFLEEFGHIARALGGVQNLKDLILELAITGKLFPDQAGESEALLSEISKLRTKFVADGIMKRQSPLPEISDLDKPFDIPNHWCFERFGNVTEIIRGVTFPASQKQLTKSVDSVACLRTANVQNEVDWSNLIFVDPSYVKRDNQWVQSGDILISMANSYELVGKVALVKDIPQKTSFGGFIASIRAHVIDSRFLFILLRSPYMQGNMRSTASQTTNIANISLKGMRPIIVPIPPLEEQSHIVTKVNELMVLCDKLEAQQQQKRRLQNHLRQSTLQALVSAENSEELQEGWERLAGSFSHLFKEPSDINELKNLAFDLTLRGFLPDSNRFIANNPSQEKMPEGWTWSTLGELAEYITSGSRGWKKYHSQSGSTFIRSQDIRTDELVFENRAYVSLPAKTEGMRTLVRKGDLLITITGGNVGKCALVPELDVDAYVSQHVALIRLNDTSLSEYIHYWIVDTYGGRNYLAQFIYGDKPGLNLGQVRSIPIPIPPTHLVNKMTQALNVYQHMCEKLTDQYSRKLDLSRKLSNSVINSLTGLTTPLQEAPMKAPKTELKAPVRLGKSQPDNKTKAPLASLLNRHNGEMSANDLWQRFGGEIDAFYAQLKTEVSQGWIAEPKGAEMLEREAD